jgi:hypothetical protein
MNEENIFAPMPDPPRQIAEALGWRSAPTADEVEEQASMDLFSRATETSNPWLAKPGVGGVLEYRDDDADAEQELAAGIEPIRKLFTPAAPARITPSLGDLRTLPVEDHDEADFFCPVKKLFFVDITSITSTTAANLNKSGESRDAPLESKIEALLDGGELALEKRLKDTTKREALASWIQKCLDSGDDIQSLAEFAADGGDSEKAALILEIGATL